MTEKTTDKTSAMTSDRSEPARTKSTDNNQPHPARQSAETLYKEAASMGRRLKRVQDLLKKVRSTQPDPKNYPDWVELSRALDGYEIGAPELDKQREALLAQTAHLLKRLSQQTRMSFGDSMRKEAKKAGLTLKKLSDSPLVLYADPLTFEIDFERAETHILYGHDIIATATVDAQALFTLRERALKDMEKISLESPVFFDHLHAAYRMILAAQELEDGTRVDLVDLALPLAFLITPEKNRRKKGVDGLHAYPRHQLAWQLSRLRADAMLERNGLRLDLGTATGGSTRDKQNVLFIPLGTGAGQYYGSIRFVPKT